MSEGVLKIENDFFEFSAILCFVRFQREILGRPSWSRQHSVPGNIWRKKDRNQQNKEKKVPKSFEKSALTV